MTQGLLCMLHYAHINIKLQEGNMEEGGNFEILQHYQEIYERCITTTKVDDTPLTNISFTPMILIPTLADT